MSNSRKTPKQLLLCCLSIITVSIAVLFFVFQDTILLSNYSSHVRDLEDSEATLDIISHLTALRRDVREVRFKCANGLAFFSLEDCHKAREKAEQTFADVSHDHENLAIEVPIKQLYSDWQNALSHHEEDALLALFNELDGIINQSISLEDTFLRASKLLSFEDSYSKETVILYAYELPLLTESYADLRATLALTAGKFKNEEESLEDLDVLFSLIERDAYNIESDLKFMINHNDHEELNVLWKSASDSSQLSSPERLINTLSAADLSIESLTLVIHSFTEEIAQLYAFQDSVGAHLKTRLASLTDEAKYTLMFSAIASIAALVSLGAGIVIVLYSLKSRRTAHQKQMNADYLRQRAEDARNNQSVFLSNISHEIRNPLNVIKGLLENLESEDDTPPPVRKDVQLVLTSVNHLNSLISDILDLKKIEEGKFDVNQEAFNLHAKAREWKATHQSLCSAKGLNYRFDCTLSEIPRFVMGDPARLNQIVLNLFSNALKFTDSGTITFGLGVRDGVIECTITDSGIGMTPETQAKLFTRFEQADAGIGRRFGGSGLGLALVKQILDALEGSITVQSAYGKGSTFSVRYPITIIEGKETQKRVAAANAFAEGKFTSEDLTDIKILCVDDAMVNLKVISLPLIRAGAKVSTAVSASEALTLVRETDFDLVLTDIAMPEMDGEELQQEIKAIRPALPVVAVTGNVMSHDTDRYLSHGFVGTIQKPIDVPTLFVSVKAYARGEHLPRPA